MAKYHPVTGKLIVEIPQSYTEITTPVTPVTAAAVAIEEAPAPEVIPEVRVEVTEVVEIPVIKEVVKETVQELMPGVVKTQEDKWTNIQVDSTVFTVFQACPQKYDYAFNQHLIPVDGLSNSINRGTYVHAGLLEYWKAIIAGENYEVASRAGVKTAKGMLDKNVKINAEYKLETLQTFLTFLNHLQGMNWIPLEVEKHFRIKAYEDESIRLRIYLTGRIDLIIKTPQLSKLPIDFKTESERWFYSQMSNQFKIYALACGTNLVGVQRVGFQEKVKIDDKFKLEMLPFDEDILEEFRTVTLPYWVKQMIIAHEENFYPMNGSSCVHGHFKCQYSDAYNGGICNVSRNVRQQKLERYFKKGEEWDPANI